MMFENNPKWNHMKDSQEAKGISDQLLKQGKMRFREGAAEEDILRFEQDHGFCLPKKFKEWLLFSDGGEFFLPGGAYFRGVAHKPLINVDDRDTPDENHIVIGALATGEPLVFEKGREEIAVYDHETGQIQEEERFSDTFVFLKSLSAYLGIGG